MRAISTEPSVPTRRYSKDTMRVSVKRFGRQRNDPKHVKMITPGRARLKIKRQHARNIPHGDISVPTDLDDTWEEL